MDDELNILPLSKHAKAGRRASRDTLLGKSYHGLGATVLKKQANDIDTSGNLATCWRVLGCNTLDYMSCFVFLASAWKVPEEGPSTSRV